MTILYATGHYEAPALDEGILRRVFGEQAILHPLPGASGRSTGFMKPCQTLDDVTGAFEAYMQLGFDWSGQAPRSPFEICFDSLPPRDVIQRVEQELLTIGFKFGVGTWFEPLKYGLDVRNPDGSTGLSMVISACKVG